VCVGAVRGSEGVNQHLSVVRLLQSVSLQLREQNQYHCHQNVSSSQYTRNAAPRTPLWSSIWGGKTGIDGARRMERGRKMTERKEQGDRKEKGWKDG